METVDSPLDSQIDLKKLSNSSDQKDKRIGSINDVNKSLIVENKYIEEDSQRGMTILSNYDRLDPEIPKQKGYRNRQYTLNVRKGKDNRNVTFLIPFDMDLNKFFLPSEDLRRYDLKGYLEKTLENFNLMKEFQIHLDHEMTQCKRFLFYLFFIIVHLIVGYIAFCIWHLLFFNFVLFVTLIKFHMKFHEFTNDWWSNINKKQKIKGIKEILQRENETEICISNKYTWSCGDNGYWLEMTKSL